MNKRFIGKLDRFGDYLLMAAFVVLMMTFVFTCSGLQCRFQIDSTPTTSPASVQTHKQNRTQRPGWFLSPAMQFHGGPMARGKASKKRKNKEVEAIGSQSPSASPEAALLQMRNLGAMIASQDRNVKRVEDEEASTVADLKKIRSDLRAQQKELDELHSNLAKLAQGGHVEILFTGANSSKQETQSAETTQKDESVPVRVATSQAHAEDNSWKQEPTTAMTTIKTKGIFRALHDGGIDTMGQLADYTAADKRLTDLKGIGKAAADKIEEAAHAWHVSRAGAQPPKAQPQTASELVRPKTTTLKDLGVDQQAILDAYQPHLLTPIQGGTTPDIKNVLKLPKLSESPFIVVPAMIGESADYRLVPLIPKKGAAEFPKDGSEYTGAMVKHEGEPYLIGDVASSFNVLLG